MHSRHSKCFWNRYNIAWPRTRQPEKCVNADNNCVQLVAAPVSRHYHSTCTCRGGEVSVADVGVAAVGWHSVAEVDIFFWKWRDTKDYNKLQTVYLQCTKCLQWPWVVKTLLYIPLYSRTHGIALPAVLSSSFAVWFWNKQFLGARVNKSIIHRRWNCTSY
jgi:hypothetical protein